MLTTQPCHKLRNRLLQNITVLTSTWMLWIHKNHSKSKSLQLQNLIVSWQPRILIKWLQVCLTIQKFLTIPGMLCLLIEKRVKQEIQLLKEIIRRQPLLSLSQETQKIMIMRLHSKLQVQRRLLGKWAKKSNMKSLFFKIFSTNKTIMAVKTHRELIWPRLLWLQSRGPEAGDIAMATVDGLRRTDQSKGSAKEVI